MEVCRTHRVEDDNPYAAPQTHSPRNVVEAFKKWLIIIHSFMIIIMFLMCIIMFSTGIWVFFIEPVADIGYNTIGIFTFVCSLVYGFMGYKFTIELKSDVAMLDRIIEESK